MKTKGSTYQEDITALNMCVLKVSNTHKNKNYQRREVQINLQIKLEILIPIVQ